MKISKVLLLVILVIFIGSIIIETADARRRPRRRGRPETPASPIY